MFHKRKAATVPLKIEGFTALRKTPFRLSREGNADVTQAMKDSKGITTDFKVIFKKGRLTKFAPIKGAAKGRIPESFVSKRLKEVEKKRATRVPRRPRLLKRLGASIKKRIKRRIR